MAKRPSMMPGMTKLAAADASDGLGGGAAVDEPEPEPLGVTIVT